MRYETTARDFFYETSGVTALTYYITFNNTPIYWGVSVKSPNEPNLRINIGRRISDYLYTSMPDFREFDGVVVPHPEQLRDFILFDGEGNQLEEFRVLYEFSGEFVSGSSAEILSEIVSAKADPRQKIFFSAISENGGNLNIDCAEPWILFDEPFIFGYIGDSVTICYTANADWNISSVEGSWYTVTQSKGDDYSGCLTFTFGDNIGTEGRNGIICMSAVGSIDGNTYTECFPVYQEANTVVSGNTVSLNFYGTYVANHTLSPQEIYEANKILKRTGQRYFKSLGELSTADWCYSTETGEYFRPVYYCRHLTTSQMPVSGIFYLRWNFQMRFAIPKELPIYSIDATKGLQIARKYVTISNESSLTEGRLEAYTYFSIDWSGCGNI